MPNKIESFTFGNEELPAQYQETVTVTEGVECDIYALGATNLQDLALISVSPGKHTPVQRVLQGEETIEGYLSGKGKLAIIQKDGSIAEYTVDGTTEGFTYSVQIGETMQWQADGKEPLEIFEICFPPFEEGRFQNISEEKL